ncbi:hypothetical protein [Humisphaera borealis]|uniref:Uncharacterized protein n=1 Tax=Humisphaera borealis TaxID=2807512 RepID=A0A7M2WUT4_9BACT|nr:hypothetical protein [Humisphaera borealis]QOV89163.1 hypothetical protein IPV69_23580 [Humisphaera borealis]
MTVATTGIDRDDFLAVAMHSAELKLVNRAISDGANPKHLLLAEPVLILPNEEPGVEDSFSKKKLPNTPKPVEPVNKGKGWLKRLMGG